MGAGSARAACLLHAAAWPVVVVSKQMEVEVVQSASSQQGDVYEKFLSICQREKSKLILGQTLSSESQALGIDGGAKDLHGQVRQDIRQWDALLAFGVAYFFSDSRYRRLCGIASAAVGDSSSMK